MSNADLLTPAIVGLVGVVIGAAVTAWRTSASEYYADVRHLRDLQAARVRAAFKPLLAVARVLSDVTPGLQPFDRRTDVNHFPDYLVSYDQRQLGRASTNLDEHVIRTRSWGRNAALAKGAARCVKDHGSHTRHPSVEAVWRYSAVTFARRARPALWEILAA